MCSLPMSTNISSTMLGPQLCAWATAADEKTFYFKIVENGAVSCKT